MRTLSFLGVSFPHATPKRELPPGVGSKKRLAIQSFTSATAPMYLLRFIAGLPMDGKSRSISMNPQKAKLTLVQNQPKCLASCSFRQLAELSGAVVCSSSLAC